MLSWFLQLGVFHVATIEVGTTSQLMYLLWAYVGTVWMCFLVSHLPSWSKGSSVLAQQTFCVWVCAAFRAWDFGESFTTVSMGHCLLRWLVSHSEESCSLLLRDLHAQDLFHFFLPQNVYFAQCLYKPICITKICIIAPCWDIRCHHGFCTAWCVSAGWAEASFNVVFFSFQPCNVWVARAAWRRD